jgi:hypothetical protein
MQFQLKISPAQLRLAMAEIERMEAAGFKASLAVFTLRADTGNGEFVDVVERYINAQGQIMNYGRGQNAADTVRIVDGVEVELSGLEQAEHWKGHSARFDRVSRINHRAFALDQDQQAVADREEFGAVAQTTAEWEAARDARLALADKDNCVERDAGETESGSGDFD